VPQPGLAILYPLPSILLRPPRPLSTFSALLSRAAPGRFPDDFMFQLNEEELKNWRSQIATSNSAAKMGVRRRPYAFTEQGVAMLSSVLTSQRAIDVNVAIMRAFVRLRQILSTNKELAAKLEKMERKLGEHDDHFRVVFDAIRQLMSPPPSAGGHRFE
jgi:hypothetical protein